jgi:TPR repeat protein
MLGSLYYSGRGVAQDYSKAIILFQKACDGRYMTGCALLGRLYESGYGINRDYSEARLLYQKACDAGTMVGCTMLGNLYSNGEGVPRNSVQAMAFIAKDVPVEIWTDASNLETSTRSEAKWA